MITKVIPKPESLTKDILLCDSLHLDEMPNPRIVPLFGPNGIGKSTIINAIIGAANGRTGEVQVERTSGNMQVLSYSNLKDNWRNREPKFSEAYDPAFIGMQWNARQISEGQSIVYSVLDLLRLMSTGKRCTQISR